MRLTKNHLATNVADPVEESKNGHIKPTKQPEEEKKQSGANLIRINICATSNDHDNNVEPLEGERTPISSHVTDKQSSRRGAQPKADATTTPISGKSNEPPKAVDTTAKPSNNMSRRRNRVNANLLAADDLEDKTKIETSANPASVQLNSVEPSNAGANEVSVVEAVGASSMRMTRNRKRQRQE